MFFGAGSAPSLWVAVLAVAWTGQTALIIVQIKVFFALITGLFPLASETVGIISVAFVAMLVIV